MPYQGVDSVSKMILTKNNIYQSLVDKLHSKLFMVDMGQLFIFQQWYHTTFIRSPTNNKADILYKFTEEERDRLFNEYIAEKIHD